jgi:uncharacterized protein (DUF1684 family)
MNLISRTAIGVGIIIVVSLSIYFLMVSTETNDYTTEIQSQRTTKDIWFSNDFESPFLKTNTPFHRLSYYAPNQDYTITAKFIKSSGADSTNLITNLGEAQTYLIYGTATFNINDIDCSLQLLFLGNGEGLFLPFMDATSSNETYGAGRYLEPSLPIGDEIILDFNTAYNPYCAYVDGFSCPFPPKTNILKVPVEAGEKSYH